MKLRLIPLLFFLGALLTPATYAYAFPPPDLILSISQTFLHMLGVIAASFVIVGGSIIAFVNYIRQRPLKSGMLIVGVIGFLILSIVGGLTLHNQIRIKQWETAMTEEFRDIWAPYEPTDVAFLQMGDSKKLLVEGKSILAEHRIVTWSEFTETVGTDYLVVDLRDTRPYELGQIPGSIHIRLAELIKGDWEKIAEYKDKPILLVCHLGTSGILAAQFLESKGFTKTYQLLGGTIVGKMNDTIPFDGISFLPTTPNTTTVIDAKTAAELVRDGATIIDVRAPSRYAKHNPYPVDLHMFRESMTETEIDKWITDNTEKEQQYLIVCEAGGSCYSARMLVFDLERAGMEVIGIADIAMPEGEKGYEAQLPPYDTLVPLP